MTPPIPRATYRLQLSEKFGFAEVAKLAPYLAELGVSHAYLSPILAAQRHSTHGYDVVDHTCLNPELGDFSAFEHMSARLKQHGLGVLLDIVPNHMGVGGDQNMLWLDVLEKGPQSPYAQWFDIDWTPPESTLLGKLLVPFLSCSPGEALEQGKLELRHDRTSDTLAIWAEGTHKLPLSRDTYAMVADPGLVGRYNAREGAADLLRLIDRQYWRPARFTVASDDINYRRFFINSELAGIRAEREDVFSRSHGLIFDLIAAGHVDGLRIDHIDGLLDPKEYCLRLRERSPMPLYLCVEKILAEHEEIPADWQVQGTTGYEFGSHVVPLLTDPAGEQMLDRTYRVFVDRSEPFAEMEIRAKREIMRSEMGAELTSLATALRAEAAKSPVTTDLTLAALRIALAEVVAHMQVYRTYLQAGEMAVEEAAAVGDAAALARRAAPLLDPAMFDFIERVLTGRVPAALPVARRFQQFSGPVMAKGLEDTALYRYNRLVALNDVGSKPDRFNISVEAFHAWAIRRGQVAPSGLLAASTHDSKRGEDVRARLAALSVATGSWADAVQRWRESLAGAGAEKLGGDDLYLFFQLLVGLWPAGRSANEIDGLAIRTMRERLQGAMLKSCREARRRTNWVNPKVEYEATLNSFISQAMGNAPFVGEVAAFVEEIASLATLNSLIMTVLRFTIPGIPDIYQGAEFWEQSLVDPDNRRLPDFPERRDSLSRSQELSDSKIPDAGFKQQLIRRLLELRRNDPELFERGDYSPIALSDGRDVLAFRRTFGRRSLAVAIRLRPNSIDWDAAGQMLQPGAVGTDVLAGLDRFPICVLTSG